MEKCSGRGCGGGYLLVAMDKLHPPIQVHSRQRSNTINPLWRGGINRDTQRRSMSHIACRDLQVHQQQRGRAVLRTVAVVLCQSTSQRASSTRKQSAGRECKHSGHKNSGHPQWTPDISNRVREYPSVGGWERGTLGGHGGRYAKGCPASMGLTSSENTDDKVNIDSLCNRLRACNAACWTVSRSASAPETSAATARMDFILSTSEHWLNTGLGIPEDDGG